MPAREKTVFFVGPQAVAEGVPKTFIGTPFIVDEDGEPSRQITEYFFARRNGDWAGRDAVAGLEAEVSGVGVLRASTLYLRNRSYQLDSYRRWCRSNKVSPLTISEASLDLYAEDLEEGLVTEFEGGILPQSVNQHLTSIIDFLSFAVAKGWRSSLGLASVVRSKGRGQSTRSFKVMRRTNPADLEVWYTDEEINRFIDEFETSSGKLAAKIMFQTGLRISEVLQLTKSTFPSLEDYRADRAKRFITVIGKFKKLRHVPISESLLRDILKYIEFDRRRYVLKLGAPSELLILGPKPNGKAGPMTARYLQKEFKRVRTTAKMSALSPHIMRHHFAAHFLLRAWKPKALHMLGDANFFEIGAAQTALSAELITLMKALGHASLNTTMKYLYAVSYLMGSSLPEDYAAGLESDE